MSREIGPADVRGRDATEPPVALDRLDPARDADGRDVRAWPVHLPTGPRREPVRLGSARYQLRGSDVETLVAVGTFRSVFARDLTHYDNAATREADVRALQAQGLIDRRTVHLKSEAAPVEVLTLTPAAQRVLEGHRVGRGHPSDTQQFYAGWVRIREIAHDASVYRMAQAARGRIEADGSVVRRVILDHELKAQVYRSLNRTPDVSEDAWEQRRAVLAEAHGLIVVKGTLQFPDVRLEYDTTAGERAHVNLELVTEHYRAAHLNGKRAAGFTLYRLGGTGSGRRGGTPHDPRRRRGGGWR
jgi:hypothetical protein